MRSLSVLAAAALAVAAAGLPAHAAKPKPRPKPICTLVKDATGDAGMAGNAAGAPLADPSLDIVSADVASDGKMLSAVIRVKQLTQSDNLAPTGRQWAISMLAGNSTVGMNATLSPFGARYSSGKGSFVFAKNEIHVNLPLDQVSYAKIKKGTVLRNFVVTSTVLVGLPPEAHAGDGYPPPFVGTADRVDAPTAAYTVGAPTCIKVGG